MTSGADSGGRIRFDVFEADLRSGELFRQGRRVSLPNQSFLALTVLLEQPGQLVTREALKARLWPDNRVVEFEQGLNAIINRLREALGDSASNARFVETLPRRGYRFIAAVEVAPTGGAATPTPASAHAASGASPTPGPPLVAPSSSSASAAPVAPSSSSASAAPSASGTSAASRAPWPAIAAIALLLAAIALVALFASRRESNDYADLKVAPLTSLVGREIAPALSPDGERLAFSWNGSQSSEPSAGGFDLYVRARDSERTLRLTNTPALAIAAAWSRDGRQLAFARATGQESGIYLVLPTGGPEKRLISALFAEDPFMQLSWSADDRMLVYSSFDADSVGLSQIRLLTLATLESRPLERPLACAAAGAPAFSPDGHQLAFLCTLSVAVYAVYVTELQSDSPPRLLASLQGYPKGLAWTANGRALIVANDAGDASALWRLSLNGRLSRLPGTEEALGPGVSVVGNRVAFVREKRLTDIWRIDLTRPADTGTALVESTRTQLVPQYSPDGTRVTFQSTRSGSSEIWVANADGSDPVKVTSFNGPLTGGPSWCSDSRRIAFDSRASGTSAIYVVDVLESRPHRLETSAVNLALPVWSEDCRWIFASDGRSRLYRIAASGGAAQTFTSKPTYRAAVSGARVIFNVAGSNDVELWAKPVEGGDESALEGMPHLRYSDGWTAVPKGIYFTSQADAHAPTLNFYDFASHVSRVVRTLPGTPAPLGGLGIAVSKDEHWLLYTRNVDWQGDILLMSGLK